MDNIVIKVGGVTLPKEVSKFKWKKSDVSAKNAGRTQDVKMHKNRVAKKRTLGLGWVNLTKEQIHQILVAFDPEYIMVTYWDPLAGTDVTKEFYTGDMEANVKWWAKGHERYSTLDFDVIERYSKQH
jgi:hypothetical protein